jgi:hypothetical protein
MNEVSPRHVALLGLCSIGVVLWAGASSSRPREVFARTTSTTTSSASPILATLYINFGPDRSLIALKQMEDLLTRPTSSDVSIEVIVQDELQRRRFVETRCGTSARERWDEFIQKDMHNLAMELWKYCALQQDSRRPVAYVDLDSPLLVPTHSLFRKRKSVAVVGDAYIPRTVHGSLLLLQSGDKGIASKMLKLMLETPTDILANNTMIIPRSLYALVVTSTRSQSSSPGDPNWLFLEEHCTISAHPYQGGSVAWDQADSLRLAHQCPDDSDFCCSAHDPDHRVVQLIRHPLHPFPKKEHLNLSRLPLNSHLGHFNEEDLPYTSTIREIAVKTALASKPSKAKSPRLLDELLRNDCFPSDSCNDCLRENRSGCDACEKECRCYCRMLCQVQLASPPKSTKKLIVIPPAFAPLDPDRLVPKIVHQFVPDEMNASGAYWYPDTSRAINSWRVPGWEYRHYHPEDMEPFLATHFPEEVVQTFLSFSTTFPTLRLDLFRYCVLLIHGGLFVNADVLLESHLDLVLDADVGFMVSTDDRVRVSEYGYVCYVRGDE